MKKKIKKLNEKDYLKSISNIVDLFYENRRLKEQINKAIKYIASLDYFPYDENVNFEKIKYILEGEK